MFTDLFFCRYFILHEFPLGHFCPFVHVSIVFHLCIYKYIHPSIDLSMYVSIHPSISLSIYISVLSCPSVHLSLYPPIHLSIYPSIYLANCLCVLCFNCVCVRAHSFPNLATDINMIVVWLISGMIARFRLRALAPSEAWVCKTAQNVRERRGRPAVDWSAMKSPTLQSRLSDEEDARIKTVWFEKRISQFMAICSGQMVMIQ